MRFEGKVVFVTGGMRGLGKEITRAFLNEGALVAVNGRNKDAKEAFEQEFKGQNVLTFLSDITDYVEIEKNLEALVKKWGRIDILINNAGVVNMLLPSENVKKQDFDRVVDTNVKGTFYVTQIFGKKMLEQRQGRIIVISSQAALFGEKGFLPYAMSKAALITMVRNLAYEWSKYDVTICGIAPGFIKGGMNEGLIKKKDFLDYLSNRNPLGRLGFIEEFAETILFLASKEAYFINGETIIMDGGMMGFVSEPLLDFISKMKGK